MGSVACFIQALLGLKCRLRHLHHPGVSTGMVPVHRTVALNVDETAG